MLQLQLDQLKAEQQAELEGTKLGIQIGKDQAELALKQDIEAAKQQLEGTKIGVDIAKNTSTPGGQTQ
jgi:hypothetical protein